MCGRAYVIYTVEELKSRYNLQKVKQSPLEKLKPNYNLAPTQLAPVILIREGEIQLDFFRWGLIPFWARDVKSASKYNLINAKGEEITEKRSFKGAFQKRRCIVPLSGFFEWMPTPSGPKRPFAIRPKNNPILSVAGIWEQWRSNEPEGEEPEQGVQSFSILTCAANSVLIKIHDRMPVILAPHDEKKWLDPENQKGEEIKKMLRPCPDDWLESYEVSTLVNSTKNNTKEVIEKKV